MTEELRQEEIKRIQTILDFYDMTEKYGSDMIKSFQDKMITDPANIEMYQFRINNIAMMMQAGKPMHLVNRLDVLQMASC